MERKDWTLLVISEAGSVGLSPVQLQKCLFLLGKNLSDEVGADFYSFVPYNYGPFDPAIYSDAQELIDKDLVTLARVSGKKWAYYVVTSSGVMTAQNAASQLSPSVREYIKSVVSWVHQLSFVELITAIYRAYPEYQVNSVFITR